MDELARLRKEKHDKYLKQKEEEDAKLALLQQIYNQQDIDTEFQQDIDNNIIATTTTTTTATTTNTNNELTENNNDENINENNNEDNDIEAGEEEEEEENMEEEEEEEEEEDADDQENQQPNPFNPMFPAGIGAGFHNNNMNHQVGFTGAHHFGMGYNIQNIHGYQPFGGSGQQLSGGYSGGYNTNDIFSQGYQNNPFHVNEPIGEPQEPSTNEEKRATFLSSIEQRYIKSPDLVEENMKRDSKKKEFKIPFENFKSLVHLCLYKMSMDLTPFQHQLKLLSGDLVQRLLEVMAKNNRLTRTKLNQILSSGTRVFKFDLSNQPLIVNNDFLHNCFKYFVEVQDVSFSNCINMTDYGLEIFKSEKFRKNLRVLDLRYNKNISDIACKSLKNLVNLEELYLGSTSITDLGLALLNQLVKLKTFDVSRCKITDNAMVVICLFSNLQLLNLSETLITDEAISKIYQKLTNIQYLYLSNCQKLTNKTLFYLTYFSKMKLLSITGTQISLNGFVHLKRLPNLQYLELPDRYSLNDQTVVHLNNLTKLRKLDLTDYIYITSIAPLDNLIYLEELLLSNTRVDDSSMDSVTKMKSLQVLSLDRTNITSAGVKKLVDLNLKSLSLMETKIDDDAIIYLSKMNSLKQLNISYNNITDKNMEKLQDISNNLNSLDLRGTDTLHSLKYFEGILKVPLKKVLELLNNENQQQQQFDEENEEF